jgi:hypothetical protein
MASYLVFTPRSGTAVSVRELQQAFLSEGLQCDAEWSVPGERASLEFAGARNVLHLTAKAAVVRRAAFATDSRDQKTSDRVIDLLDEFGFEYQDED